MYTTTHSQTTRNQGSETVCESDVKNIANGAKSLVVDNSLIGRCRSISTIVSRELRNRHDVDPSVYEFEMGDKRVSHFAVVLPFKQYQTDEYRSDSYPPESNVIIDPTIKQFSVKNHILGFVDVALARQNDLPNVGVYHPECEERIHWYHSPEDAMDRADALDYSQYQPR